MTPPPRVLQPGARLGPWRIERKLGQGGMGVVYSAADERGQRAAVKVLAPEVVRAPRARERFRRESSAAAAISDRHVVRCLGSGEAGDDLPWIAFELVPGGSLADRVKGRGPLPWRQAASLAAQVARGLAAIHAAGIVHRDLKPANVLVASDGTAKVSDLGLSRSATPSADSTAKGADQDAREPVAPALTRTGELIGTVEYIAPEQVDGARDVGAAADLYALGCLIHFLVAGTPPFPGSGFAVVAQHLNEPAPSLSDSGHDAPSELEAVVAELLDKDPARRPASAAAVALRLERIAASRPRRAVGVGITCGVVLLLGAGLTGLLVSLWRSPEPTPAVPSATPSPIPSVLASPTPAPPPRPSPAASPLPAWFRALPPGARPEPLPPGLTLGATPGEYVWSRDGSVLVYVPPGEFLMGVAADAPADPDEDQGDRPQHRVALSAYFIGKYELSNARFAAYVTASGAVTQAEKDGRGWRLAIDSGTASSSPESLAGASWRHPRGVTTRWDDARPVVQVVWSDAVAYGRWAGLRLPTEAEWERAAGWDAATATRRRYPWGDEARSESGGRRANVLDFAAPPGDEPLRPVTDFADFPSPVGAVSMGGNVAEWVQDAYDPGAYADLAARGVARDPCVTRGKSHVQRGGSWVQGTAIAQTTRRYDPQFDYPDDACGFRVALSADQSPRGER